jgi:hypothetical protein
MIEPEMPYFRGLKQFLGLEDPQNRGSQATERTAPLISSLYDLVLLWHAQSGHLCGSIGVQNTSLVAH